MLERLFQKIFVSIVPVVDGHEVLTVVLKKKKVLYKEQRHFEGSEPSRAMNRYIQETVDASPLYYISTINTQAHQGAHAGCMNNKKTQHSDDTRVSEVCRNKKWTLYASFDDLHSLTYEYQTVGLDFIFSPFSILEYSFADKIKETFALYAFSMPGLFTVAIFDKGTLEYAHYYTDEKTSDMEDTSETMDVDFNSNIVEEEDRDGLINLDDIEGLEDLDIIDDLDSLSDIDDLNELEEVHEFSEDMPTNEEKRLSREHMMIKEEMDSSAEDYQHFSYIQKTLHQFYGMPQCGNRFVETVCIVDSKGASEELKRYLEEELFLNVLVRKADVLETINALAMEEEAGL
ncbi:MAG: hypothetical protein Q8J85_05385 [Sulfuricurvum sp.]|nr:hypothetical protein [Sulfuricurvum sp.]MDP3022863.1 hypothetical protein [Sulfuricurvum sp.]